MGGAVGTVTDGRSFSSDNAQPPAGNAQRSRRLWALAALLQRADRRTARMGPLRLTNLLGPFRGLFSPIVHAGLQHPDGFIRYHFLHVAEQWGSMNMAGLILRACRDEEHTNRSRALEVAVRWNLAGADQLLLKALENGTWWEQHWALDLAGHRWGQAAIPHITPLCEDEDSWVRTKARWWRQELQGHRPDKKGAAAPPGVTIMEDTGRDLVFTRLPLPESMVARGRHVDALTPGRWTSLEGVLYRIEADDQHRWVIAECSLPEPISRKRRYANKLAKEGHVTYRGILYVLTRQKSGSWAVTVWPARASRRP